MADRNSLVLVVEDDPDLGDAIVMYFKEFIRLSEMTHIRKLDAALADCATRRHELPNPRDATAKVHSPTLPCTLNSDIRTCATRTVSPVPLTISQDSQVASPHEPRGSALSFALACYARPAMWRNPLIQPHFRRFLLLRARRGADR